MGLEAEELRMLRYGAALHDIGKLAIPASILTKPSPLTLEERSQMERHTLIGEQILAPIRFLRDVLPLVRHGHERWDGTGCPDRLAGEEIPLGARIIFACDAYDAITTDRPYRPGKSPEEAQAELRRCAGTQLDPAVVEALIEVLAGQPSPAS
jgi:HD-GYP domain-containing protein (c-di-GMP phosphodiesterase class II)